MNVILAKGAARAGFKTLKYGLKILLIFSLAMPLQGQAKSSSAPTPPEWLPTVAAELPADTAEKPLITISYVEPEQEQGLLKDLVIDGKRQIVIYHNGPNDPLIDFVMSNPDLRVKATLVDASNDEPAQSTNEQRKTWGRLKQIRSHSVGILVAAGTAGLFSAPFYFSSGLEVAAKIYLASLTIFTLQAVFTQQWQKLLSLGGKASSALHGLVRKVLKKEKVEPSNQVVDMGRMGTAFVFNAGTATLFLNLSGEYDSMWTVLTLASLGVYDITWDLVVTRLQEMRALSAKTSQKFIQSRIVFGALLDSLAIVVAGPVLVAMGGLLSTGVLSLFGAKSLSQWLTKHKKDNPEMHASANKIKSWLPNIKAKLRSMLPKRAKKPCRSLLLPNFYEDVA